MDLGISGKKAIICASSRGLGKACAESLASEESKYLLMAFKKKFTKNRKRI